MTTTTCQAFVTRKTSRGILARGAESFRGHQELCGKTTVEGRGLCAHHIHESEILEAKLQAKRAAAR